MVKKLLPTDGAGDGRLDDVASLIFFVGSAAAVVYALSIGDVSVSSNITVNATIPAGMIVTTWALLALANAYGVNLLKKIRDDL